MPILTTPLARKNTDVPIEATLDPTESAVALMVELTVELPITSAVELMVELPIINAVALMVELTVELPIANTVALIVELTVELPTFTPVVVIDTLDPTFIVPDTVPPVRSR